MQAKNSIVNLLATLKKNDKDYDDYLLMITCSSGTYKAEHIYYLEDVVNDINEKRTGSYDLDTQLISKIFSDTTSKDMKQMFDSEANEDVVVLQNVEYTSNSNTVTFFKECFMFMDEIVTITLESKSVI